MTTSMARLISPAFLTAVTLAAVVACLGGTVPGRPGRRQAARGGDHPRSQGPDGGGGRRPRRGGRLARRTQNPHDLEVRPSLMVKLRRADALVVQRPRARPVGRRRRPGRQQPADHSPGAPGRIDFSRGFPVLEVPSDARRPLDGRRAPAREPALHARSGPGADVTGNILEGLARVAPAAPRRLRAQPHGIPGAPRPGDGALAPGARPVQGHQGRRVP